ncbi:MAG: class I SAM-dependent methyltransferase, partial [Planctomycetes bacterium]|nr:class I SAM-dependent methyltransferase [Planctomycetota bacterium]
MVATTPSFVRNVGKISYTYQDSGLYGDFINHCRMSAWTTALEKFDIPREEILDVGCGKGYLLYEFTQAVPGVEVAGLDISKYAIENSKEEVKPYLQAGNAVSLPFPDNSFDYVVSLGTLHNLYNYELRQALQEIERVGKNHK